MDKEEGHRSGTTNWDKGEGQLYRMTRHRKKGRGTRDKVKEEGLGRDTKPTREDKTYQRRQNLPETRPGQELRR
jgi:hypothetical protein